jgi:hypothetical protein
MEIITRKQAQELLLEKYFTGKPCKNGHISERYTGGGVCIECQKTIFNTKPAKNRNEISKRYYDKNKDEINKKSREKYKLKKRDFSPI